MYLVLNRTRDTQRGELLDALWPDGVATGADLTLRTLLSKIRRTVGVEIQLQGGGHRILLPPTAQVDFEAALDAIHRAEAAVAGRDWRRAWGPSQVALFTARRGFLPGEEAPWTDEPRRTLADIELRALECYAASCLGVGGIELPGAERAARRLVDREPFRESGHRILMRALAEGGNVATALLAYDDLASLLRRDLGVDPSPQTKELHRDLLRLAY